MSLIEQPFISSHGNGEPHGVAIKKLQVVTHLFCSHTHGAVQRFSEPICFFENHPKTTPQMPQIAYIYNV